MLLPRPCAACGAPSGPLCPACADQLVPAGAVAAPPGADGAVALLRFEGVGRDLVLGLKYRNRRGAVGLLAHAMARTLQNDPFDLITWAPTSAARRRVRGFDQARLLARALSTEIRCPCRGALRRLPGPPQTGRDRLERAVGPAFVAARPVVGHVLLVDDVVTTGATLAAATAALRAAGASGVNIVTAAATPLKVR